MQQMLSAQSSSPSRNQTPEQRYQIQLQTLEGMGFLERAANLQGQSTQLYYMYIYEMCFCNLY